MKRRFIVLLILAALVATVSADTLIVYTSGTGDGFIGKSGSESYANKQSDTTGDILSTTNYGVTYLSTASSGSKYATLDRGYYEFNTSNLPDSAPITAAVVSLKVFSTTNGLGDTQYSLVLFTPATNGTAAYEDYDMGGTTLLSNSIATGSLTAGQWANFTLTSTGRSYISKTGWTNYMLKDAWDISATPPTWQASKNTGVQMYTSYTGGSEPFITITYSVPPISSFSANVTSGTAPLSVQFNDTSTNTPTGWNWSYNNTTGNGTQIWWSTTQNATTSFGVGNWSIKLNTSNSAGSNISTQVTYINVSSGSSPPVASFSLNKKQVRFPQRITVNDTSTNTPTTWNWSWGDGTWTNGTANNTTHQYLKRGNWNIQLIATNAYGSNTSTVQAERVVGLDQLYFD